MPRGASCVDTEAHAAFSTLSRNSDELPLDLMRTLFFFFATTSSVAGHCKTHEDEQETGA